MFILFFVHLFSVSEQQSKPLPLCFLLWCFKYLHLLLKGYPGIIIPDKKRIRYHLQIEAYADHLHPDAVTWPDRKIFETNM